MAYQGVMQQQRPVLPSSPHHRTRLPRGFLSHGVHSSCALVCPHVPSCALVCLHVRYDDTLDGIGVN